MELLKTIKGAFYITPEEQEENTTVETTEAIYNPNTFTNTDFSIKDKIESVKTDKFKAFESQLNTLKAAKTMNLLSCYQAASITNGISLVEINENIIMQQGVVNSIVTDFKNKNQFEINEFEQKTNQVIVDNETQIAELNLKIKELNDSTNKLKNDITEFKSNKNSEMNEFENSANIFITELSSFESEVKANLKIQ